MPHSAITKRTRGQARSLRRAPTDAERKLWFLLRSLKPLGMHFRRQAPIGIYIADFVWHAGKIVVELDGSQHVFAAVGGYYGAADKTGKAGVFRHQVGDGGWSYVLKDLETFTVFVNPRDPSIVFAGTTDGVYRSTDAGATFKRANFPDKGVQIWSFM